MHIAQPNDAKILVVPRSHSKTRQNEIKIKKKKRKKPAST